MGRVWQVASFGPEMFKLKDRNDRDFCLGPTAEEYFTTLIRDEVKSYKQLPLVIYQIQTKYRDEKRPRFGINRAREFLMKDAYSFDTCRETGLESYKGQWKAYEKVFDRLKLDYKIVEGDSGAMGGDMSHEFIALSETGEGVIAFCEECSYAATDEKAKVVVQESHEDMLELEEVLTEDLKTIEDISKFFEKDPKKCLKAVDLIVDGEPTIVFIPGDRELNMAKLVSYLKVPEHLISMAERDDIVRVSGAEPGFTGPVGLKDGVRVIIDRSVTKINNLITGANKTNYHYKNVNYSRDFEGEVAEDLLCAKEGDICPECGKKLKFKRGIEVGNIFLFGEKYSKPLHASFLDENGKEVNFYMGSYGIGVTRSVTAIIEQNHDDDGIIWPIAVAPYEAIVTIINNKDEDQLKLGEEIYNELKSRGVDAMLDDRKERAGIKFADRDLIGIPLRITVGKLAKEGKVEFSTRKERENEVLLRSEAIEKILKLKDEALND